MSRSLERLRGSPLASHAAPFLIFAALTACQGRFGTESQYWLYAAKTLLAPFLLWAVWPAVREVRWTLSIEAVVVGVLVIVLWIALDPFYRKLSLGSPSEAWNPIQHFGQGTPLAWFFIVVRIAGATLVVPPLEELFYRSFVYRYIISQDFEKISLQRFHPLAFFLTATVFGCSHREWLAGIICGMAYQWLVLRKGHLGDAITAHAISNLLLGLWVVHQGAWQFW